MLQVSSNALRNSDACIKILVADESEIVRRGDSSVTIGPKPKSQLSARLPASFKQSRWRAI